MRFHSIHSPSIHRAGFCLVEDQLIVTHLLYFHTRLIARSLWRSVCLYRRHYHLSCSTSEHGLPALSSRALRT